MNRLRSGPTTMRIEGKVVNRCFAKIVYRCEECLGKLRYRDSGLACLDDPGHRGLVHRDKAARLAKERAEQMAEVTAAYEIVNGQIVAKGKNDAD